METRRLRANGNHHLPFQQRDPSQIKRKMMKADRVCIGIGSSDAERGRVSCNMLAARISSLLTLFTAFSSKSRGRAYSI